MTDRPLPEAVERAICRVESAYSLHSDFDRGPASAALRAAIAAALAPGEPVAWGVFNGTSFKCAYDDERAAREDYQRYAVVPLYAAPPALPASVERRMAFMEVERAVAEEREACAKACEDRLCVKCRRGMACGNDDCHEGMECAAAIRARGGAK